MNIKSKICALLKKILSILIILWTLFWIIGLLGISHELHFSDGLAAITVIVPPYLVLWWLYKKVSASIEVCEPTASNNDIDVFSSTYIETVRGIRRADGQPISDEEVPYLIKKTIQRALDRYENSIEDLDDSSLEDVYAKKRLSTALPSYQDIIHTPLCPDTNITSTDIFFLKYINGRSMEHADLAQYWYWDYGLNYSTEIKKLYSAGLLCMSNINLVRFKVDELKNILRHFNLSVTGTKHVLLERIADNIPQQDLLTFLGEHNHYFTATEKGCTYIESIIDSATFNLELENSVLSLILDYDYENAFYAIQNFRLQMPAAPYSRKYDHIMDDTFDSIMLSNGFFYTLEKDRILEGKIKAAIVFCNMWGSSQDQTLKLIKRIYAENGHVFSNDAKNLIAGRLL